MSKFKFPNAWLSPVGKAFCKNIVHEIETKLIKEKSLGARIFPENLYIFRALELVHFEDVKVIILGQDPYHGPRQAHGLCFSVKPGVQVPPSLKNIYKELQADVDFEVPSHGCLQDWAQQGVLLLNAVLTVQAGQAASHQGKGWERFTDAIVGLLNKEREGLIFMLWGSHARKKGAIVDRDRHLVLQSPHPSPLSASRGFFGNHHFSRANSYLESKGKRAIDWQLPMQVSA